MKCEIPVVKLHGSTFKLIQNDRFVSNMYLSNK